MSLNPQQFHQLPMFASGTDVKSAVTDSSDRLANTESMDQMWSRKEAESRKPRDTGHGAGVYDSMKGNGYVGYGEIDKVPVLYANDQVRLVDGHHRVAAAAALDSEGQDTWVPLRHLDLKQQSRQDAFFGPKRNPKIAENRRAEQVRSIGEAVR